MLIEVRDTDLIAKEFQKHKKCYREYTMIVRKETLEEENLDEKVACGNYDVVLSIVKNNI